MNLRSTLTLDNGTTIPVVGLGVYQAAAGGETRNAVLAALATGYRHVDTARIYNNEKDVGDALRESGVPRGEVFVTTKLWNSDQGYDRALKAFDQSLARLGLDYVDLYLIHWPLEAARRDSWKALEAITRSGRAKAIGVSNFVERHITELLDAGATVPAVNQFEMSPFLAQRSLRAFCAKHGIAVEAYSPLTRGERLGDARLVKVARALGRTPAQVLIRWCIEKNAIVLPKSTRAARIEENARVFDFALGAEAMTALDALDEGLHTSWDPTNVP